jgi:hypothetical protein
MQLACTSLETYGACFGHPPLAQACCDNIVGKQLGIGKRRRVSFDPWPICAARAQLAASSKKGYCEAAEA